MSFFVIAGMPECSIFNHCRVIADTLTDKFPNFKASYLQFEPAEWKNSKTTRKNPQRNLVSIYPSNYVKVWLKDKNVKYNWYHLSSPIIWKELTLRQGKPHLIGGASEFWEYCNDYYNLECLLPKNEIHQIVEDFKQFNVIRKENQAQLDAKKENMIICISSNQKQCNIMSFLLLRIIKRVPKFAPKKLIIRIHRQGDTDDDLLGMEMFSVKIEIVADLNSGLRDADLLIIIGNNSRYENEDLYYWLYRNKIEMETLADYIDDNAKQSLRVIVAINGPVCFNAAILLENVTKIYLYNIVAETSSTGLEPLSLVKKVTGMPLEDMTGPPVWGFTGVNQLIDLEHITQKYDVYRPNARAVKNNYNSALQLGKLYPELRYMNYLADPLKTVWIHLKKKQGNPQCQENRFAKTRGIMALIDNWYFPEFSGNIMSLGILSNGSFNIPSGIVFSQPVTLKNDRWVPVKTFPIPRKDPCGIDDLIPLILNIYRYFKIREHILAKHNFN